MNITIKSLRETDAVNKRLCSTDILMECPACGKVRWVVKRYTEMSSFTGYCRQCNRLYTATRLEYPSKEQVLKNGNRILWNELQRKSYRNGRTKLVVPVYCSVCKSTRLVEGNYILRTLEKGKFLGFCKEHSRLTGPDSPIWRGGITRKGHGGYIRINLKALSPKALHLALQMTNDKNYVLEHRLVMAKHLDRPLESCEIVHHKNGIRSDNRIENLELRTQKNHSKAHGEPYYQLWQEALSQIERLKWEIASLKP